MFTLFDSAAVGYLSAKRVIEVLRILGAVPTASQAESVPEVAQLADLRAWLSVMPDRIGYLDDTKRVSHIQEVSQMLDTTRRGFIARSDLLEMLLNGLSKLTVEEAHAVLEDSRVRFTDPRTDEIEVSRFISHIMY